MAEYKGEEKRKLQWEYPDKSFVAEITTKYWRSAVLTIFAILIGIFSYAYGKLDTLKEEIPKTYATKESVKVLSTKIDYMNDRVVDKMDSCFSDLRTQINEIQKTLLQHAENKK